MRADAQSAQAGLVALESNGIHALGNTHQIKSQAWRQNAGRPAQQRHASNDAIGVGRAIGQTMAQRRAVQDFEVGDEARIAGDCARNRTLELDVRR